MLHDSEFAGRNIYDTDNTCIYVDTLACGYVSDMEGSIAELQSVDGIEIGLVVSGNGVFRMLGRSVPCSVGDIYILNSNVPHGYFITEEGEPLRIRRLTFSPAEWLEGELAVSEDAHFCYGVFSDNVLAAYAMLTPATQERVESYCDMIAIELSERREDWRFAVRANLDLLLITLSRYVNRAIKNIPSADEKDWGPVATAMFFVNENFDDCNLTLEAIANSLYISKSYLSKLFKRITGESFSDHLRNVRVTRACELLRGTDFTIEKIVLQCGLRDIPTFYRVFQSYTGITPNQYRLKFKNSTQGEKTMSILKEISENLQKGKAKVVKELVQQALDEGLKASDILTEGLLSGMNIVGEKFKNNEVYVPEVLVAARAMNMGTQILKPFLAESGVKAVGRVCIGTVQGDLHDIGKNLVKMMLEGKGFEVIDLGTDVSPEAFVNAAIEHDCQIICCSALLTTTMGVMEQVVAAATAAGIRDKVKIMVGGAPTNEAFANSIGADGYTVDAASAADMAVSFVQG